MHPQQELPRLTPEEQFLYDCCRYWRTPDRLMQQSRSRLQSGPGGEAIGSAKTFPTGMDQRDSAPIAELDWDRVLALARHNRLLSVLHRALPPETPLSASAHAFMAAEMTRLGSAASSQSAALRDYLHRAAGRGIETVVLKGLALSIKFYGDMNMRPGGDIDLLMRRRHIATSLAILDEMGLGRWWPNLLDDAYYDRHHLHQQRCTRDLKVWFEPHWALDHPHTLLTIDYEAMIDRAIPSELLGEPVHELDAVDLLLSVAIHLVKHAIYLPSVLHRADLARIILADGMLVYFLDTTEIIAQQAERLDWHEAVVRAHAWGAAEILGSVLFVCRTLLHAPVPDTVLAALPVGAATSPVGAATSPVGAATSPVGTATSGRAPTGLTHRVHNGMANHALANHSGQKDDQPAATLSSRLWRFLVVTNGAFILRPIRILEMGAYLFPTQDYLQRRYSATGILPASRHLLMALARFARLGLDTVYYTLERYVRLKRLRQSASLFNRLEVDEGKPATSGES